MRGFVVEVRVAERDVNASHPERLEGEVTISAPGVDLRDLDREAGRVSFLEDVERPLRLLRVSQRVLRHRHALVAEPRAGAAEVRDARRLAAYRQKLYEMTRELLRDRLRISDAEFERLLALVRSQIAVSIRGALAKRQLPRPARPINNPQPSPRKV